MGFNSWLGNGGSSGSGRVGSMEQWEPRVTLFFIYISRNGLCSSDDLIGSGQYLHDPVCRL